MIVTAIIIGAALVVALFIGVPYYHAHQRRAELARREQEESERAGQEGTRKSREEEPKK